MLTLYAVLILSNNFSKPLLSIIIKVYNYSMRKSLLVLFLVTSFFASSASECTVGEIKWSPNWKISFVKKDNEQYRYSDKEIKDQVKKIILNALTNISKVNPCLVKNRLDIYSNKKIDIINFNNGKASSIGGFYNPINSKLKMLFYNEINFHSKELQAKQGTPFLFRTGGQLIKQTIVHEFLHFLRFDSQWFLGHNKSGHEAFMPERDSVYACSTFSHFYTHGSYEDLDMAIKQSNKEKLFIDSCRLCASSKAKSNKKVEIDKLHNDQTYTCQKMWDQNPEYLEY